MKDFDIYFFGQVIPGNELADVKAALMQKFKLNESKIDLLFSGKGVLIKANINVEQASKYRESFRSAGAIVDIVPTGQKPTAPKIDTTPKPQGLRLMPLGVDLGPGRPEQTNLNPKISEPSDLKLSPVSPMPEAEPPIPLHFDTSAMTLGAAEQGSLEDCAMEKPPVLIPDISTISLSAPGTNMDSGSTPAAAVIPTTSHLNMMPANTGSLADCVLEKPPVVIPDISQMQLTEPSAIG